VTPVVGACSGEDGDDASRQRAQFHRPAGPMSRGRGATPGERQHDERRRAAAALAAPALRRRRRRRLAVAGGLAALPADDVGSTSPQRRAQVLAAVGRQLLAAVRLDRRLSSNIDRAYSAGCSNVRDLLDTQLGRLDTQLGRCHGPCFISVSLSAVQRCSSMDVLQSIVCECHARVKRLLCLKLRTPRDQNDP